MKTRKIVFCWSNPSGYMAACWRALHAKPDIEVFVLAHRPGGLGAFSDELLEGIPHTLLDEQEREDAELVGRLVEEQSPDVIMITGWWLKPYRELTKRPGLKNCRFWMGVDTPWRNEFQYLNRIRYRTYFNSIETVFVAGERAWQHVRRLGFGEEQIVRGMYGVDAQRLSRCAVNRRDTGYGIRDKGDCVADKGGSDFVADKGEGDTGYGIRDTGGSSAVPGVNIEKGEHPTSNVEHRTLKENAGDGEVQKTTFDSWPRRFLFAGRYVDIKGIDILVKAYSRYREEIQGGQERPQNSETALPSESRIPYPLSRIRGSAAPPWDLVCCGKGPLADFLKNQKGITDRGFVQPDEMLEELTHAGCFVLPSRYDPWPLALVEACAAGLPVIASQACGSGVELLRDGYNGFTFATGSVEALTEAMLRAHVAGEALAAMGERAMAYAQAYSAEEWAGRVALCADKG